MTEQPLSSGPLTFVQLARRRARRARAEKFRLAHEANLRLWAKWWDHSGDIAQDGEWAGMARDLKRTPF